MLAQRLGLTGAIGTRSEVVDGAFTGQLLSPILHGPQKSFVVREFAREHSLNLIECTGYSDSFNDLPMLRAVGHPVVVNADFRLRMWARKHGWPSYDFRRMRYARKFSLPAAGALPASPFCGGLRPPLTSS